jgi:ribosome-associated protein
VSISADNLTFAVLAPWVEFTFARSAGPGGQHVNKVNTRADLLFDFQSCEILTPAQRARIRARLATRMSRDGRLRVVSQKMRSQSANREAAADRLVELLRETLKTRKPRRATKPSRASRERRLADKKRRGDTKRLRHSKPSIDG